MEHTKRHAEPLTTRTAQAVDRDAAADLLLACNMHYFGAQDGAEAAARLAADGMIDGRLDSRMLIGWRGGDAVAFATYAILQPGPTGQPVLFMKDLFVLDADRSRGTGEAMLRALAAIAVAERCCRLDWTAEAHNTKALAFYDRLHADRLHEKVYYRFSGEGLARFAGATGRD